MCRINIIIYLIICFPQRNLCYSWNPQFFLGCSFPFCKTCNVLLGSQAVSDPLGESNHAVRLRKAAVGDPVDNKFQAWILRWFLEVGNENIGGEGILVCTLFLVFSLKSWRCAKFVVALDSCAYVKFFFFLQHALFTILIKLAPCPKTFCTKNSQKIRPLSANLVTNIFACSEFGWTNFLTLCQKTVKSDYHHHTFLMRMVCGGGKLYLWFCFMLKLIFAPPPPSQTSSKA